MFHEPISYRFWDRRRFPSKIAKMSPPLVFCAPRWRGCPWNWVSAHGVKKLEWWGYRAEKDVWRYLQPCGYNPPTWRTNGRTDTERQQRLRLRIASRGKNLPYLRKLRISNNWHIETVEKDKSGQVSIVRGGSHVGDRKLWWKGFVETMSFEPRIK